MKLNEKDYEEFFSPETMATLKGKSAEKQMLGNKSLRQAAARTMALLPEIIRAEEEYIDELDVLAAEIVREAYPIIDDLGIEIDAKIVPMQDIQLPKPPEEDNPTLPDFGEDDPEKAIAKRRVINGITHGASVRGAFSYLTSDLFESYMDQINPELVDKYNEILGTSFGIYDDEDAIAMLLAMIAQNQSSPGGRSEAEWEEDKDGSGHFVIKARATCFPVLVHEIVKGLYEIVAQEGFTSDAEKNKAIIGAVDKVTNEPRDLQYGKFIYDAISKIYNESDIDDARVREFFFAELYKLGDDEFLPFVENAINDKLTASQKQWAKNTMKDIESGLKKRDTGLEDLD